MLINSVWDVAAMGLCIALGGAASLALCKLMNILPAKWFCDYGEEPTADMFGKRFDYKKTGKTLWAILAAAYVLSFMVYRYTLYSLIFDGVITVLAAICVSDVRYTIIPDQFTAVLAVIAVAGAIYDINSQGVLCAKWYMPLLGCTCGAGIIILINLFSQLAFKKIGIGFGDLKLFAALGILTGVPGIFVLIYLTVLVAFFHFMPMLIAKKYKKDRYYPMGPYICAAAAAYLMFGGYINKFIFWYIGLIF